MACAYILLNQAFFHCLINSINSIIPYCFVFSQKKLLENNINQKTQNAQDLIQSLFQI